MGVFEEVGGRCTLTFFLKSELTFLVVVLVLSTTTILSSLLDVALVEGLKRG